ncbi:MAG: DoxX family protein [Kofleriaceae bacterium]
MTARTRTIAYWITTALAVVAFAAGGAMDLARGADVAASLASLGYPLYLATILGVAKLLGAAVVAAPGLPRLKEWAYAGMMIDLVGAAASHAAIHDTAGNIVTPLVVAVPVLASWALRPAGRRLGTLPLG